MADTSSSANQPNDRALVPETLDSENLTLNHEPSNSPDEVRENATSVSPGDHAVENGVSSSTGNLSVSQNNVNLPRPLEELSEPRISVESQPASHQSRLVDTAPPIDSQSSAEIANAPTSEKSRGGEIAPPSFWSRLVLDTWTSEIASAFLSLASMVSIVGVLVAYDQKAAPSLPKGITLNAVIAVLGTIAKTSLLTSLASSIGQYKWLWLRDASRKLRSIQVIDDASRGPLGSLMMLKEQRVSIATSLGALATILLIGLDPFVQQLLVFQLRLVPLSTVQASLPAPSAYEYYSQSGGTDAYLAALTGIFGKPSDPGSQVLCPGGNCIWPTYHALAMCSKCVDASDRVSVTGEIYDVNLTSIANWLKKPNTTMPKGIQASLAPVNFTSTYSFGTGAPVNLTVKLTFDNESRTWEVAYRTDFTGKVIWASNLGDISMDNWANRWTRLHLAGVDGPLLGLNYLHVDMQDDSRLTVAEAYECILTPCVHQYRSRMSGGKFTSEILSTDYGYILDAPRDYRGSNWTATVNGTHFYITDSGTAGGVGGYTSSGYVEILVRGLYEALTGVSTSEADGLCELTNGSMQCFTNPTDSYAWTSTATEAIDSSSNSFPQILGNVAAMSTDLFQRYSARNVSGSALEAQTYVEVRWLWLIYPAVLIVMGTASLLSTIHRTRRNDVAVWKSSLLPLLYRYGDDEGTVDADGKNNRVSQMDAIAGKERIQLSKAGHLSRAWVLEKPE